MSEPSRDPPGAAAAPCTRASSTPSARGSSPAALAVRGRADPGRHRPGVRRVDAGRPRGDPGARVDGDGVLAPARRHHGPRERVLERLRPTTDPLAPRRGVRRDRAAQLLSLSASCVAGLSRSPPSLAAEPLHPQHAPVLSAGGLRHGRARPVRRPRGLSGRGHGVPPDPAGGLSGNEMLTALGEVVTEVLAGRTLHGLMPDRPNPEAIGCTRTSPRPCRPATLTRRTGR